ncbi:hypothetical protein [Neobacillus sp. Marseille-QA0830]
MGCRKERHHFKDKHHHHDKDDDCCCCQEKDGFNCKKDCLCRILKNFRFNDITIKTKSGDIIMGELEEVTKDCCVKIMEPEVMTPFISERLTVIRCKDIESFTVDLMDI